MLQRLPELKRFSLIVCMVVLFGSPPQPPSLQGGYVEPYTGMWDFAALEEWCLP